jgi:hypothetical protein
MPEKEDVYWVGLEFASCARKAIKLSEHIHLGLEVQYIIDQQQQHHDTG